jgi:hypothetical protein
MSALSRVAIARVARLYLLDSVSGASKGEAARIPHLRWYWKMLPKIFR